MQIGMMDGSESPADKLTEGQHYASLKNSCEQCKILTPSLPSGPAALTSSPDRVGKVDDVGAYGRRTELSSGA
jgi:hypothetical protein